MNKNTIITFIILFFVYHIHYAQKININGAVTLDLKLILGNQNNLMQLGVSGFGISNYQQIAVESGVSVYLGYILQKHTIKKEGFVKGYDFFYLLGYGNNNNLLGSSLSQYNSAVLYNEQSDDSFYGFGFGFEKQYLPEGLKEFEQRIGRLMMRFSKESTSYQLTFKNDLRIGNLFYGDATDFGATGSLYLNYLNAVHRNEIHQLGFAIELFTPQPDYNRIASNLVNSDDGRKNVWHTKGVYNNVFYANGYVQYQLQRNNVVYQINSGIESNKLGAYVQNKLHDSFGLNPRFPWDVNRHNQYYIQGEVQTFINSL